MIAVSKRVPPAAVEAAIEAGVTDLGENYVQEMRNKVPAIAGRVRWHFIGALQSGTAQHVADLADVVHTAGPERATRRLAARAERVGRVLDVLLEVDFTGVRAGIQPTDVVGAAGMVETLTGLRLRGLMTIAPQTPTPEGARPFFRRLRELRDELADGRPDVLELSMGMSFDYDVAVQEGATMVRIGTAVFGPRTP